MIRAGLIALLLVGCTPPPSAYQRGLLRHPTMTAELRSRAMIHLESLTEGAIGGIEGTQLGCGCN